MKRFIRNTVLSCAVAATTIAPISIAYAGQRWDGRHEVARQSDDGDVLLAGLLGLAAGAIIVSAITQPEPRAILDRDPNDGIDPYESLGYFPPAPHDARVAEFVEPTPPDNWDINDRGWFKYCDDMYRWGKSRGGKMSCSVE
jgi:hypothetical protein